MSAPDSNSPDNIDAPEPLNNRPAPPERLIVGQVVAPFGIKGELKVNIFTDFPDRFSKLQEIIVAPFGSIEPGLAPTAALDPGTLRRVVEAEDTERSNRVGEPPIVRTGVIRPPRKATTFQIEGTHIHKGQLLLKLKGVENPNDAEALRGCWLLVPVENARKLPRGAYYIYQIVGLKVVTPDGKEIGKVEDVITASANDVYVVKGPGVEDRTGELLVPAVKAIVQRVDLQNGIITIADPKEWS